MHPSWIPRFKIRKSRSPIDRRRAAKRLTNPALEQLEQCPRGVRTVAHRVLSNIRLIAFGGRAHMKRLSVMLALLLAYALPAFAQIQGGSISGTIKDEQGG